jgi:hypothetical protein
LARHLFRAHQNHRKLTQLQIQAEAVADELEDNAHRLRSGRLVEHVEGASPVRTWVLNLSREIQTLRGAIAGHEQQIDAELAGQTTE